MKGIEEVFDGKRPVALIFRANAEVFGASFLTPPASPLQIGIHAHKEAKNTNLHEHSTINAAIEKHEVLLVQKGYATIDFYSTRGKKIATKKLSSGDGVLVMKVMHQVRFSPNSKVIEIKQGPYSDEK